MSALRTYKVGGRQARLHPECVSGFREDRKHGLIYGPVAERAARLSAYVDARGGSGYGDSGHDKAVKKQNKRAAKIRKALGYCFPKCDITF